MNKLTTFFILIIIGFSINNSNAQDVEIYYDAAGNRILREIVRLKSSPDKEVFPGKKVTEDSFSTSLTDGEIKIYPNPTKGKLKIEVTKKQFSSGFYKVHTLRGKKILEGQTEKSFIIDLSPFKNGTYLLDLKIEPKTYFYKIIKS
ncbi:MAG: T9SS type A sorting domain-containing protein [Bacteroidota bacterium]